jgi:hypothetical protein
MNKLSCIYNKTHLFKTDIDQVLKSRSAQMTEGFFFHLNGTDYKQQKCWKFRWLFLYIEGLEAMHIL